MTMVLYMYQTAFELCMGRACAMRMFFDNNGPVPYLASYVQRYGLCLIRRCIFKECLSAEMRWDYVSEGS